MLFRSKYLIYNSRDISISKLIWISFDNCICRRIIRCSFPNNYNWYKILFYKYNYKKFCCNLIYLCFYYFIIIKRNSRNKLLCLKFNLNIYYYRYICPLEYTAYNILLVFDYEPNKLSQSFQTVHNYTL